LLSFDFEQTKKRNNNNKLIFIQIESEFQIASFVIISTIQKIGLLSNKLGILFRICFIDNFQDIQDISYPISRTSPGLIPFLMNS
jgi:hypothetical protein